MMLLAGCDPTRRLAADEVLLKRNKVRTERGTVAASELEPIIKQKPNKRVLAFPFYLQVHNVPNPAKVAVRRARKDARMDRKNAKREARGKAPLPYKRTRAEWLRETVGEPPTILDASLTERSREQMRLYMVKEGYFHADVSDTVQLIERNWYRRKFNRPKARVTYTVTAGTPYRLRTIKIKVDDAYIRSKVEVAWDQTLLKPGDRFDGDIVDKERGRITELLRGEGYLFFNRELIQYDADTTVGDHQMDLTLSFERPVARKDRGLAGTPEGTVYDIRNVDISTFKQTRGGATLVADTLRESGYTFHYQDRLRYRTKALLHPIFIHPGDRFDQDASSRTYRRLTSLNVFDRVDISYDTTATGQRGKADAHITLLPSKQQSITTEGFATNRGGAFGTSLNVGYRHRNVLRTLGSLQMQVSLGLEAQQRITGDGSTQESTGDVRALTVFNTVSIGPELTFSFPRPFAGLFSKSSSSKLLLSALYNYQRRPDYTRDLGKLSVGVQWQESSSNTIGIYPLEVNVIRIPLISAGFRDYLEQANNPVLLNSYTDHLITSTRLTLNHSTPGGEKRRDNYFLRASLECAWPVLWGISEEVPDTTGKHYYTVAGVRYAEYVKADVDMRWRRVLHERSSLAFRVAAGAALPYGNLGVLPFESSFFVGGANGLRAWRARSIGPGSYNAPLAAYDRIGELKLEGNAEYRFKLIGFLEGALFADVGNIWNFREDPQQPGATISSDFLSELAVGTGVGARFNFDFFIVRFDLGLQTKDPSLPPGERWLFQPKDRYEASVTEATGSVFTYKPEVNFNLGIGYPF